MKSHSDSIEDIRLLTTDFEIQVPSEETVRDAKRCVHRFARNKEDELELLEALGL